MKNNLLSSAYHILWKGADFIFPPLCAGCGEFGRRFCSACYDSIIPLTAYRVCEKCGETLTAGRCRSCDSHHYAFKAIKSWGVYNNSLRKAVHSLKFKNNMGLGDEFAPFLSHIVKNSGWAIDVITPVPISLKRKAARGYNQSAVIAFPLALNLGKPYKPSALIKNKETRSQVGLTPEERFNNAHDAFFANPKLVTNKSVLIVDDVTTTGATLHSCALALLQAGAREVYCITIAKARLNTEMTDNFVIENI